MNFSPRISRLIEALRCLPGVGPKSAQRMALQLLERDQEAGLTLAGALQDAIENVRHCSQCRTLCEDEICPICSNPQRQRQQLCVIESPADSAAIEQSGTYQGLYFVLHGHLSPLDGLGPQELGLDKLVERVANESIEEVIMAVGTTVEGEATVHYIREILKPFDVTVTRIAQGVPMGGELEYIDRNTLSHAFQGRRNLVD